MPDYDLPSRESDAGPSEPRADEGGGCSFFHDAYDDRDEGEQNGTGDRTD